MQSRMRCGTAKVRPRYGGDLEMTAQLAEYAHGEGLSADVLGDDGERAAQQGCSFESGEDDLGSEIFVSERTIFSSNRPFYTLTSVTRYGMMTYGRTAHPP